jgi:hypothetical protein
MDIMEASLGSTVFLYLVMGGLAAGLLEFGVGAMLWAEEKILLVFGFIAAMGGLYVALRLLAMTLDLFAR